MPRPQTIQIYLPAGDPRGIRVAEITTRIVRVSEVPRSQLAGFLKMPEAQQVGVYFLIGESSEAGLPRVYIGQSGNVGIASWWRTTRARTFGHDSNSKKSTASSNPYAQSIAKGLGTIRPTSPALGRRDWP